MEQPLRTLLQSMVLDYAVVKEQLHGGMICKHGIQQENGDSLWGFVIIAFIVLAPWWGIMSYLISIWLWPRKYLS
jgi:hypothetical protein